ncbi:hypothetical protein [Roseinatronobacter alkalisoli]|uniref:Uncharacterized protein n=1 Tax=Roseinatronobacter alkalisoli TaxID=3028235 RepID=A0ABT5TCP9_9RHOB|nr:hypothetical protein [Roseinatronobacter sp. HJB301]MDD7972121.1 hypothetical protein [Roseinatronobacter sp. HJB301]
MFDWDSDFDDLVSYDQNQTVAAQRDGQGQFSGRGMVVQMLAILCLVVTALVPGKSGTASGPAVMFAVSAVRMHPPPDDVMSMPTGLRTYSITEFRTFISGIALLGDAELIAYARITARDLDHAAGRPTTDFFHDAMTLLQMEMARRGLQPAPAGQP